MVASYLIIAWEVHLNSARIPHENPYHNHVQSKRKSSFDKIGQIQYQIIILYSFCINSSSQWIDAVIADGLAPCIASSSATMTVRIWDTPVLVYPMSKDLKYTHRNGDRNGQKCKPILIKKNSVICLQRLCSFNNWTATYWSQCVISVDLGI